MLMNEKTWHAPQCRQCGAGAVVVRQAQYQHYHYAREEEGYLMLEGFQELLGRAELPQFKLRYHPQIFHLPLPHP